jgi:uncharacterized protein (DUF2249 family)
MLARSVNVTRTSWLDRPRRGADQPWPDDRKVVDLRRRSATARRRGLLAAFDRLREGETLSALDDRDIRLLYYGLAAQRGGEFWWRDLKLGPLTWVVEAEKMAHGPTATMG